MGLRSVLCALLVVAAGVLPPEEFAVRIKSDPSLVAPEIGRAHV